MRTMTYSALLWTNSSYISKVFVLHKNVHWFIVRADYNDHCNPIVENVLPIPCCFTLVCLIIKNSLKTSLATNNDLHNDLKETKNLL